MPVTIDHKAKKVTFTKKLTVEENLLVADLVARGYTSEQKTSKQSGHNKKWLREQLPDDAARAEFDKFFENKAGLGGWRKAKKWAKDTHGIA